MKPNRLLVSALLVLAALTSCAATMRLEATAPTQDNAAACGVAPVLGPSPTGTILTVWFSWSGPETGSASVTGLAPGTVARLPQREVAPGTYTVRAWAVDQAGNISCDTTAAFTFKSNPYRVSGLAPYIP